MEGGGGSFSVVFRRLGQGRAHGTRWDEEMATFACAAGPVSRAVGMGLGVESSRWVSGASLWCVGSSLG